MCLDCGGKVNAFLPKCITNAGDMCHGAITFTRLSGWCMEIRRKYGKEIVITVKVIGIVMFTLDLGTDSFTGVHYISIGKVIEGTIILIFTVLPMLCVSLRLVIHAALGGINSRRIGCLPSITTTVCSTILPLGWLVQDLVASISISNPDNENDSLFTESTKLTAEKVASLIKLFLAFGESYPQTIIQLFIVFATLAVGEEIGSWLWFSVAVSLISVSLTLSTGYLNAQAAPSSKVGFFVFGMFALISRQVVCCVYSMHNPVLYLLPFCIQLASSIIIQSISSKCQGTWIGFLIFVLTEAYNSFTLSGLLTSTLYLGFAIGGFFLLEVKPWVQPALVVALVLASLSWTFNVFFTVVPQCEYFRNDWIKKPDAETTQPIAEGAISGAEVA